MKILRLRLQNLNSLVGEWCIDFEHPDYTHNSLFAITGPTGAGKSTILDAICLGLFGETPRLGNINKSDNEIMSRHQAQCFAEVTFSVNGKRYRSTWSQSRARKRKDGKLQDSKHELVDANSNQILEDKKSRTLAAIEAITHLNFKRFTRSVLLAQGSFAAFLQASVDERSDMLQQITGTEIYETISKQVHINKRDADSQLQWLQAAASAVVLLDEAALNQLQHDLQAAQSDNNATHTQLSALREQATQQQRQQELHATAQQLADKWQAHEQAKIDLEPDYLRLQAAEKAHVLQAEFQRLSDKRARQQHSLSQQQVLQDALPPLQAQVESQHQQWQHAQTHYQQLDAHTAHQQWLWQQVQTLDRQLENSTQHQNQLSQQQTQLHTQHQALLAKQSDLAAKRETLQQQMQHVVQRLRSQTHLRAVHDLLPLWKQQWQEIQLLQPILQTQEENIDSLEQTLNRNQTAQAELQQFLQHTHERQTQLANNIEQEQQAIATLLAGKPLSEYQLEQELLQQQQLLLSKIESLEQERLHLQAGDACPLCGALEHPYVQHQNSIPSISATDIRLAELSVFFQTLHEHERTISQWQTNHNSLMQQCEVKQTQLQQWQQEHEKWEPQLIGAYEQRQHTHHKITTTFSQLKSQWAEHTLPPVEEHADWSMALEHLQQSVQHYQRYVKYEKELQEQWTLLDKDWEYVTPQTQQTAQDLHQIRLDQAHAQQQHAALQQERHALFGTQSIEQAQNLWQQTLQAAQKQQEQAYMAWQNSNNTNVQAKQRLQDAQTQTHAWQQELDEALMLWQTQLQQHDFADEAAWQAQCLASHEMERLRTQQTQWQHTHIQLEQARRDNQHALANLNVACLSAEQYADLHQQIHDLQAAYQQQNQHIGGLKQQWQQQQQAQQLFAEQHQRIQAQQALCQHWCDLHELIGSSDGKKFRLFAQSLTFNHLVQQANIQLQNMSERYLLQQSRDALLQLDVIDQFQDNEIRSAKNLSGGESFIVSLALALGLARLSSHNTRIESLFLDEGFGTLDEEALETALNALASLQHEGKIIGIISHVAALKERIATQIRVEPQQGGVSLLKGSGISR